MQTESHILMLMSGSIACAKATNLISTWRKAGHEVRVACTRSVQNFVGRATLEGLSGQSLLEDTFEAGRAMEHIDAAQWADLVIACPASANLLARFSNGIADDLVTTLWQAAWDRNAPLVVVPAMNGHMWNYPATRENVRRLRAWGIHVLPTAHGDLACGETGEGRMLEPEEILKQVDPIMNGSGAASGLKIRKILVTGGGTREPIDAVRYIGNHSTGGTAATLVDTLTNLGHEVTWLGGAGAAEPVRAHKSRRFVSFNDLEAQLRDLLSTRPYDAVVHAAAVSDFSLDVDDHQEHKITSDKAMTLNLRPNPKLLQQLRDWSGNDDLRVVGFKLTVGADEAAQQAAVVRQLKTGAVDLVVHNDFDDIQAGRHPFTLFDRAGARSSVENAEALAHVLHEYLETDPDRSALAPQLGAIA